MKNDNRFNYLQQKDIKTVFSILQRKIYDNAIQKGFFSNPNLPAELALVHSEISEALEALRHGNPESDAIPGHRNFEEELTDAIIRLLCILQHIGINGGSVLIDKHNFNLSRPAKHGKEF